MKKETADFIRDMDGEKQSELVSYLAKIMTAEAFCDALVTVRDTLSDDAEAILDKMNERYSGDMIDINDALSDVDRLHEAICEGRKQDAIDILNSAFPVASLRPVETQNRLFPDRVVHTDIKDIF